MDLNEIDGVNPDEIKKVRIILKNRCEIAVRCKDFSILESGNAITMYNVFGVESGDYPLYINNDEIAAIVYEKENLKSEKE